MESSNVKETKAEVEKGRRSSIQDENCTLGVVGKEDANVRWVCVGKMFVVKLR